MPIQPTNQEETAPSWNILPASLSGTSRRVAVHLFGIAVGLVLAFACEGTGVSESVTAGYMVTAYIGLVCLLPRGMTASPSWYMPTLTGLVQAVLVIALGVPWQYSLFFAGLQTWLSRLALTRGKLGWEWSAAFFLLVGITGILTDLGEQGVSATKALLSVVPLTAVGWIAATAWMKYRRVQIRVAAYDKALQRLPILARLPRMPERLADSLRTLAATAAEYRDLVDFRAAEENPVAAALAKLLEKAEEYRGALALAALKGDGGTPPGRAAAAIEREAERITKLAADELQARASGELGLSPYQALVRELGQTAPKLPGAMCEDARAIADSAAEILRMMEADPADVSPGKRFLERYLKAACRITADYARLKASATPDNASLQEQLEKTPDILSRIRTAFLSEQQALLQNDSIGLGGDIGALDALLKMQGHPERQD